MTDPAIIAIGRCFTCRKKFTFNPDRVPSVLIDPETNRPPDVDASGQRIDPSKAAIERSVKRPYCPYCAKTMNMLLRERGEAPVFDETDTAHTKGRTP